MDPFMSHKTVCMTYIINHFTGESVFLHSMSCLFDVVSLTHLDAVFLSQFRNDKPTFSLVVNIFLTKTYISIYFIESSVNFTWFALFSRQKFDDRPLF